MTALSAKVDEHALWFDTPLPGRLSDVFGLKTNAFYDARANLQFEFEGKIVDTSVRRYEVLEPAGAKVVARFSDVAEHPPVLSVNDFGKGKAYYLATEPKEAVLRPLLDAIYPLAGVTPGPATPEGVYARVVQGRTLYVNTTEEMKEILITGEKVGGMTKRKYAGTLHLDPQQSELLQ